ncbi:MAG TPA: HEAT repeat domain-containing protein [Kofleriaceae bacterium]
MVKAWLDTEPAFDRFRFAKKLIASLSGGRTWREEPGGLLSRAQLSQQVERYARRLLLSTTEAEYVLRSAIQDQGGSVPTWARLYDEAAGAGSTASLLVKLVAHSDPTVRRGAARAIADVADPKAELPALSVKLTLEDPIEDVRRAAGRSLTRVAGNAEVNIIRQALQMRHTRSRAVEAVTDLVQFGSPEQTAGFPRRIRLAAEWHRRRRVYREHKERIRDRASVAAIHGLVAALGFVIIAGIPTLAGLSFLTSPATVTNHWPVEWLLTTARDEGVALLAAVLASALHGWRSGTHLARQEALGGPAAAWASAGVHSATSALVPYVLLFGALAFGVGQLDDLEGPALLAAVLTAIWWQLGPFAARWIYRTIEPGCPTARAVIWSTIAGVGLASVPTAGFAMLLSALGVDRDYRMAVLVTLLFLVVGANLCVTGLVLYGGTQSVPASDRPASSARARRRARGVVVAGFVGAPIIAAVALGPSWTPLVPMRVSLGTRSEVELPAIPARSHSTYFRIEDVRHDSVVWIETGKDYHNSDDLVVEGSRARETRIVRAGATVLAAATWSAGAHDSWKVHVVPIHELAISAPATSDRWTFARTPVQRVAPGIYHGTVNGTSFGPLSSDARVRIQLAWPASDYTCGGHHAGDICPPPPVHLDDDDLDHSSGTLQSLLPDGTWSYQFNVDAPSRVTSESFEILVAYRLY